jgi:DNA-binding transcriptional LysR family regulator
VLKTIGGPLSRAKDLARHPLIGWEEDASGIMAADWLARAAPAAAFVYRTSSLVNQLVAAKAGIGLALLPCYLGDGQRDLVRALDGPVAELAAELWIVTHADLKATARVRAFFDIVGEGLARERDVFAGAAPMERRTRAKR